MWKIQCSSVPCFSCFNELWNQHRQQTTFSTATQCRIMCVCVLFSLLSIFSICSVSFRFISFLCTKSTRKWNTFQNATAFYFVHSTQSTLLSMLCGNRFSIEFLILFRTFWYNVMAQLYPYSIPFEVRVRFCCLFILKIG